MQMHISARKLCSNLTQVGQRIELSLVSQDELGQIIQFKKRAHFLRIFSRKKSVRAKNSRAGRNIQLGRVNNVSKA